jgi:AcrR family transcriptional regulator
MARQGYEQTTIRDVSRETGVSLAGLYYYVKSKEDLLYQIQHRTFASLLERQEAVAAVGGGAEDMLRALIENHLRFFTEKGKPAEVDRVVRHRTLYIFGMLNWVFMWFDPPRDGPVERVAREMADLVLPGLRRQS